MSPYKVLPMSDYTDGPRNGLVGDVAAVWWRWIADVDLLNGAVDCRGSAVDDFSWRCLDLAVMSIVHKPLHW